MKWWGPSLVLIAVAMPVGRCDAQTPPPLSFDEPSWMWRWSPIAPLADLRRKLPGRDLPLTSLLSRSAPRVGLFWTAGVPGALPAEASDQRAEFRYVHSDRSGAFRRPLDPGVETHNAVAALAWGSLGGPGAGIGRVTVDRGTLDASAYADILEPYGSDPYSIADTIGDAVGRTAVRLEGAGGWRVGAFGLGLAAGYHQQETRTIASAVPRQYRNANPGLTAGVSVDLLASALQLGLMGRWQQEVDQVSMYSVAAPSRVYPFSGYEDPVPRDLVSTTYNRRFERTARAVGAAVAGDVGGVRWVVHGRVEDRSIAHFRADVLDAITEEWAADGWTLGASVQRRFFQQHLLVTLDGWYQALAGESHSPEIEGVPFAADERVWSIAGEMQLLPTRGWQAAIQIAVVREERDRRDGIAGVHSDLAAWRPVATLAMMRTFGPIGISLGGALSEFNPSGAAPACEDMGSVYQEWIAPELAAYVAESAWYAGMAGLRWQVRPLTAFTAEARYDVARAGDTLNNFIGAPPTGERKGWSVTLGILLGVLDPS